MPFDPDAYLAKAKADSGANGPQLPQAGFNPDAYLAKAQGQKQEPTEEFSPVRTGVESFANAATAGYLPHLQAAAEPYTDKLFASLEGKEAPEDNTTYVQRRDANIARLGEEAKQNPKSALGGMLAGSVAGGALAGGVLPEIGALGKVGQAALGGGLLGAASNPGDTQGQLAGPQLEDRAKNAGIGALTGGVAEKAIGAIQGAPAALKNFAQEKAFKSSGAMLKDFRKAFARDRVNELGQAMIDNGLVSPGMSFADVAEKSNQLKQQAGNTLGRLSSQVRETLANKPELLTSKLVSIEPGQMERDLIDVIRDPSVRPKIGEGTYDTQMYNIIKDIMGKNRAEILVNNKLANNPGLKSSLGEEAYNKLRDTLVTQTQHANLADVKNLNDIIGELDTRINWSKRVPELSDQQQGLLALRRFLRTKVNDVADTISSTNLLGDKKTSDLLKQANKQYGNMAEINRISSDRSARVQANRVLSPSDYGAGALGAIVGSQFGSTPEERLKHALLGAGLGAGNHILRLYGNPALTTSAFKMGNALQKTGIQNLPNNPAAIGAASGAVVNNLRR